MLGKTCYLTSSHFSLQAYHLKSWRSLSYFYVPSLRFLHSVAPFSDTFLSYHPFFYSNTHSLSLLLSFMSDAILDMVTWALRLLKKGEGERMSKVEESDVTSQSCWQCVLCSALPNPMLKNRKNRPHSSKQLPKPPQHESRGETAGGIQALIPVLIIHLRFDAASEMLLKHTQTLCSVWIQGTSTENWYMITSIQYISLTSLFKFCSKVWRN